MSHNLDSQAKKNGELDIFRTVEVNPEYISIIIPNTIHGCKKLNIRPLKRNRPGKKEG